jgi:hypothetical protein
MKTTNIVLALILLNAAASVGVASGVFADWGIQPDVGGDQLVNETNREAENLSPAGGGGLDLLKLFTQSAQSLRKWAALMLFGGPLMLSNMGIPGWLVGFVFAPAYLIVGADVYYALTGRRVN